MELLIVYLRASLLEVGGGGSGGQECIRNGGGVPSKLTYECDGGEGSTFHYFGAYVLNE